MYKRKRQNDDRRIYIVEKSSEVLSLTKYGNIVSGFSGFNKLLPHPCFDPRDVRDEVHGR